SAVAKSADGQTMPILCDDAGKLRVTTAGGGGANTEYTEGDTDATITGTALMFEGAANTLVAAPGTAANGLDVDVTRIGTVTITATDLDVQSGGADLATVAAQLPDGHNVTVDNASIAVTVATVPLPTGAATSAKQLADGHNVTVDNASIAVTGTFFQGTQPVSAASLPLPSGAATSAKQLADGHGVASTLVAGVLKANSPTTEVAVLTMIDGSADTDIVTTNLGKSSAITVTGSGAITKVCLVVEGTSPFSEDGTIYFFDADPAISSNTADMTVAEAISVVAMISLTGADYNDNFATIKINCQLVFEPFHSITHVAYEQQGSTTIANQDFRLHIWYRRDS
ncbi:hypothetical protein LCGC14_2434720, partial [marine sediment metagenome]